ncbi:MAG: glycosyltransferase [Nitrospirota bacterium]|nr:glycosyltransferase [Nitrospirota bacterium]
MNILLVTNTFFPHVGGVARSVAGFADAYRQRGHRVLVVAPLFPGTPPHEEDVLRVPALQQFNGSDFSVGLPSSLLLAGPVREFAPDIVHSNHPFLLGNAALRLAHRYRLPLLFTHHTLYEHYTHYVPLNSPALRRFVIRLATEYANLCDTVFAPSGSVADLLRERGVTTPVEVVPTGVDVERFARGDGAALRQKLGIPASAPVIGHAGRLAPEKNLNYLAEAVALALEKQPDAHFLLVGEGPSGAAIENHFQHRPAARFGTRSGAAAGPPSSRLHRLGLLDWSDLADAYRAMDVFAFASRSETQGMVLTEAMAAGVPVVALDAPGAREVVRDGVNGRLLSATAPPVAMAEALLEVLDAPQQKRAALHAGAVATAGDFSMPRTAARALEMYSRLVATGQPHRNEAAPGVLDDIAHAIATEWDMLQGITAATRAVLAGNGDDSAAGANEDRG